MALHGKILLYAWCYHVHGPLPKPPPRTDSADTASTAQPPATQDTPTRTGNEYAAEDTVHAPALTPPPIKRRALERPQMTERLIQTYDDE